MISRTRNALVKLITEQVLLPKLIVLVLDDDLLTLVRDKAHTYKLTKRLLSWLINQFGRIVQTQKEYLPEKAKKNCTTRNLFGLRHHITDILKTMTCVMILTELSQMW